MRVVLLPAHAPAMFPVTKVLASASWVGRCEGLPVSFSVPVSLVLFCRGGMANTPRHPLTKTQAFSVGVQTYL